MWTGEGAARVHDQFDVTLEDDDLLGEVELTTTLIIAASESDEHLDPDTAERVRCILEECGSRGYAEALASDFANRAWDALHTPAVTEAFRTEMRPLVSSVLGRTR